MNKLKALLPLCFTLSLFAAEEDKTRLAPIVVQEKAPDVLQEESPTGPYNQPEWTTHRRFTTTRAFIQRLPWEFGFEQWWRGRFFRDGSAGHLLQHEFSLGLPYRIQADVYENWTINDHRKMRHDNVATEIRWALADWGKIPLNPTIYGEWKFVDETQGPDVFEVKLLLAEEIAPRWHWALNGVYEQEVGGSRTTEWAVSQGISYTLIDQKLSAGVEMVFKHESEDGNRHDPEIGFLIGPSLQWRPRSNMHLDVAPLVGVLRDSPRVEAYIVFGIDFGGVSDRPSAPTSTRGK
jgi:hypothetical protein